MEPSAEICARFLLCDAGLESSLRTVRLEVGKLPPIRNLRSSQSSEFLIFCRVSTIIHVHKSTKKKINIKISFFNVKCFLNVKQNTIRTMKNFSEWKQKYDTVNDPARPRKKCKLFRQKSSADQPKPNQLVQWKKC